MWLKCALPLTVAVGIPSLTESCHSADTYRGKQESTVTGETQVHDAFYSLVAPTPTGTEPYLVAYSPEMAADLGLDREQCERPEFAETFSGNSLLPGTEG